jgi:hypothetical protein
MVQPRLRARLQALALLVLLVLLTAGATGFAGDQDLFKKVLGPFATEEGNFRGGSWADYDGDGDLDLFVPRNMAHPGSEPWNNLLYRNDTVDDEASFTNVNAGGVLLDDPSSHSKTGLWGDYDNDGDLDLFVANEKRQQDLLYENDGVGGFARITNGVAGENSTHTNSLYHNESIQCGNTNHWIKVRCEGTESNRSAFGTLVRVKAVLHGKARWQLRDIASRTTSPLYAHFGLADATKVDTLRVE